MSDEIDYESIDANAHALVDSETPAVTADTGVNVVQVPLNAGDQTEAMRAHGLVAVEPLDVEPRLPENWSDLSDSQKLDILHMKVDRIGAQVAWIGQTFQGVIDMVGKVSPMDIFKMMRGGK